MQSSHDLARKHSGLLLIQHNKLRRRTFQNVFVKVQKKIPKKRRSETCALKILYQIIDSVVQNAKQSNSRQNLILSILEQSLEQLTGVHIPPSSKGFEQIQQEPISQSKPGFNHNMKYETVIITNVPHNQLPVKQIISRRQDTILVNEPLKKLSFVARQEEQIIKQFREEYLRKIQEVKRKNQRISKINADKIRNKNSRRVNMSIINNLSKEGKIEEQINEQKPSNPVKKKAKTYSEASSDSSSEQKTAKQNKNSKKELPQNQNQKLKSKNAIEEKEQNRKLSLSNIRRIKKSMEQKPSFFIKQPIQQIKTDFFFEKKRKQLSLIMPTLSHKNILADLPRQLTNNQGLEPNNSNKRKTLDKQKQEVLRQLHNKRMSLPLNALQILKQLQLQQRNNKQTSDLIKTSLKQNTTTPIQKSKSKSPKPKNQNSLKPFNSVKTLKIVPKVTKPQNEKTTIKKTKDYSLKPMINNQNSNKIQDVPLNIASDNIKNKFGNNVESKHQIIELLQALQSPHSVTIDNAYSPIPIRLQKIRKYISNNSKNKKK